MDDPVTGDNIPRPHEKLDRNLNELSNTGVTIVPRMYLLGGKFYFAESNSIFGDQRERLALVPARIY